MAGAGAAQFGLGQFHKVAMQLAEFRNAASRRLGLGQATGLILAACLAAGCGFQLRTWDWAGTDLRIHVRADAMSAMAGPLRRALAQAGATVSPVAADADIVIRILNERRSRRIASVVAGARAAEYELVAGIQYAIRTGKEQLVAPRWAEASRVFSIDRTSLTGSSEEQALIEGELQTDLVQNVLRSLNAAVAAARRSADAA